MRASLSASRTPPAKWAILLICAPSSTKTRLSGLRFNFDIGHAHLSDFPEGERIEKSFSPLGDLVPPCIFMTITAKKDEHLPPYDGAINWPAAIKLLKIAPEANLPLVLEVERKRPAPEAPDLRRATRGRTQVHGSL